MTILSVRTVSPYITNPRLKRGIIKENITVKDKSSNPTKPLTTIIRNKVRLRPVK